MTKNIDSFNFKCRQGQTSKQYYTVNYRYYLDNNNTETLTDLDDMLNKLEKIHMFLGIVHYHRYDIPNGYNPKHGYIYDVLLTDENDDALAICQIHPLEGNMVLCKKGEKIFDFFVETFKSGHRDELNKEYNKKY
jgi:hypothetical protein